MLDHLKRPYAKLDHIEFLVLDEADRMLDMGFLPDIRRLLRYLPRKRQTLFFSATMPDPIRLLTQEMLHDPAMINLDRKAAPAVGITQAVYPVGQELKSASARAFRRGIMRSAGARAQAPANRCGSFRNKISVARIHVTSAGRARRRSRVIMAASRARRHGHAGAVDVEALGHVVNFDVPAAAEDYIHRVGRTARAELTGEAFTLASPDETDELRSIERAIGKPLLRVTLPDFDYDAKPTAKLEVPRGERIAEIRARRNAERARAKAKAERPVAAPAAGAPRRSRRRRRPR